MLVLARTKGQRIVIAQTVTVKVLEVGRNRVRLGIEAPEDVAIRREESESGRAEKRVGCQHESRADRRRS